VHLADALTRQSLKRNTKQDEIYVRVGRIYGLPFILKHKCAKAIWVIATSVNWFDRWERRQVTKALAKSKRTLPTVWRAVAEIGYNRANGSIKIN